MSLDYEHLLRLCLKYWMWLAGAVVVGFVGGYLYALSQTAIYETYSQIVVNGKDSSMTSVGSEAEGPSPEVLKTLEQMLQTKDLPDRVVRAEHLNENAEFLAPTWKPPVAEEAATALLANEVSIRVVPLTHLIDITVDHPSAKMAKFLADRLAEQSILQRIQVHSSGAGVLSTYLAQEVERLKDKVKASRQALHDYEVSHKEEGIAEGDKTDLSSSRLVGPQRAVHESDRGRNDACGTIRRKSPQVDPSQKIGRTFA